MAASKRKTSQNKYVALLQKDPKKSAVLAVLVVMLGGMWMKMAMSGKTQPQQAAASDANAAASHKKKSISP